MNKFVIPLLLLFLSSCSTLYKSKEGGRFKVEFGNIIEIGENIVIQSNQFKVQVIDGVPLNRFGVKIQNIEKEKYDTAFYIEKFNEETNNYDEIGVGGYWLIKPPENPYYEAFLSVKGIKYLPGNYRFGVVVGKWEVITIIEFIVVHVTGR